MKNLRTSAAIAVSIASLTFSGCVPLVAVGAVAGTGAVVFARGHLSADINADVAVLHKAGLAALRDMHIFVFNDVLADKNSAINGEYADGTKVEINVEKVSEIQSKLTIRIGILGDEKKSKDILGKIYEKLK